MNPPRLYDRSQITRPDQDLGLSRKRSSQTARQGMLARIQTWRRNYWSLPYPFGIADIAAADMIDIDEAVVNLASARLRYGKSLLLTRARHTGSYTREDSIRILLAISGDPNLGYRWAEVERGRGGTNLLEFYNIIDRIANDLNQRHPGCRFCFIMENLNIHHNPMVLLLILMRGHRFVFRAPCHPVDGPI